MQAPRTVVVTGASSGIGEACALRLDQEGFRVFAGVRNESDGRTLQQRASDRLAPLHLDVTDPAAIDQAARAVAAAVGDAGLAGLLNNAGITAPGPLEYLPTAALRDVLDVNVIGHVAVTQAFLPLLHAGRGRIVFMSSLAGRVASPLSGAYAASKFALEALADAWRMELESSGVSVSVIEPGTVATPIWEKGMAASDEVLDQVPMEGRARYERISAGMRAWAERSTQGGVPMSTVTSAVVHALTARRPRTRYAVGRGSRLFLFLRFAPDRARDRLLLRLFA
jgi:NAD(P)-dependent dehydrogenase (short-subunit alcohol dehydrogenase family)